MSLAILCSGQGHQHSAMFSLVENAPEAGALFAHCATLLGGVDPRAFVARESDDVLHGNRYGQILCTLQALATFEVLRSSLPCQVIVAGYSVGEVAAWGVAGVIPDRETLDLVAARAEIMDGETSPGDGLLFIRGLTQDAIEALCARYRAAIAIINPGDAYIVGGGRQALASIADAARQAGALRVTNVPVSVASHTYLLNSAAVRFQEVLQNVSSGLRLSASFRLISGIDGSTVIDVDTGLAKLARQISHTVRWSDCLQSCVEAGATSFLELGPGRALSEMAYAAYPALPCRSVDEFSSMTGVVNWIDAHS